MQLLFFSPSLHALACVHLKEGALSVPHKGHHLLTKLSAQRSCLISF